LSGIAAAIDHNNSQTIEQMLEKIRHRGRDEQEIFNQGSVQLGEISFDREQQGKVDQQNGYGVVLDGIPYLKNISLTKVQLLNMYLDQGPEFVKYLDGKFAMVISNGDDFFAARDLFGIKPLYYYSVGEEYYFASEMKAFTNNSGGINIFPPGHFFTKQGGLQRFKEIPAFEPEYGLSVTQAEGKLRDLLIESVNRSTSGTERTGVFLSGGVDSSIIAAAAKHCSSEKIFTYAAGLESSPDIESARIAAEDLETEHKEYLYDKQEILEALPEIIYYLESFDVELINSSIANYFVSRLVKSDNIKVVLSGEGADELFAGYHYLKQYKDDAEVLSLKMQDLLKGMHNGGFQRVDRMAKAHSLEVEMPFVDSQVINFALKLPNQWKITEEEMGKWLLRKAFSNDVPEEIIWRRKAQFGVGSGTEEVMNQIIEEMVSEEEYREADQKEEISFKSKEEYYYHKIFKKFFPNKAAEKTVNRWLVGV